MSRKETIEDWQSSWGPAWRTFASVLILIHVMAVFIAPWSSPPPAPQLAAQLTRPLTPYQVAAFLNHGYRFFAPDPGPSHIIRYEMQLANGETLTGRLPDPDVHWPRLLYHRYFMMTETARGIQQQIQEDAPRELMTAQDRKEMDERNARQRQLLNLLSAAIAQRLLEERDGTSVQLYLQRHEIPFPQDVLDGMRLDDERLYADLADLGEFKRAGP